jgi:ribosomal protein L14E/L6E/L27E
MYIRCIYVSKVFTIRIPREVKEKMRRYKHINWSEIARSAILNKLKEVEEVEKRLKAAETMDRIREEMLKNYGMSDYDSAEVIRYWRSIRR